jgi:hypothetical protein
MYVQQAVFSIRLLTSVRKVKENMHQESKDFSLFFTNLVPIFYMILHHSARCKIYTPPGGDYYM